VMRILWMRCASASPAFAAAGLPSTAADIVMCYLRVIEAREERERGNACKRQRINQRARESLPRNPFKGPKGTLKKKRTGRKHGGSEIARKSARANKRPQQTRVNIGKRTLYYSLMNDCDSEL
jgi:hypothetical protein